MYIYIRFHMFILVVQIFILGNWYLPSVNVNRTYIYYIQFETSAGSSTRHSKLRKELTLVLVTKIFISALQTSMLQCIYVASSFSNHQSRGSVKKWRFGTI